MPDYTQSKIYKITSVHTDKCYIGSTTMSLKSRYNSHKCDYKKKKNCGITSKILLKLGDCKIELILNYSCNNKHELELIESYYIQKNNCVNVQYTRGGKKWYEKNKDKVKAYTKIYDEKNKEYKKQYNHRRNTSVFGQLCKLYNI